MSLILLCAAALAQTAPDPAPTPEKPKQSGFVSPDGSGASVLTSSQKQLSDDIADQVFQNEMNARLLQSQLNLAKVQAEISKLNPEPAKPVVVTPSPVSPAPTIVTSAISEPSPDRLKAKADPAIKAESRLKIIMILGTEDHLVAVVKIDQLGSVQVRKNDVIPFVNWVVTDIEKNKITARKANGEVIYIPFISV